MLRQGGIEFSKTEHADWVDRLISTFTIAFFEKEQTYGNHSDLPVFVVGMPRSGTTLVEQIVSSHPQVSSAGELENFNEIVEKLPGLLDGTIPYPQCLLQLSSNAAGHLADTYLTHLQHFSRDAARITDKMPQNYLHLGLIALLLPKACIIHCQRDAMDVCLSCYFQSFKNPLPVTYDLADLGFYYRQYEKMMAHWRSVLPLQMLEVEYEKLVENKEEVSRQIIAFCGLAWDEKCLAFYENTLPVKAASKWQVRQPICATSVGRWRNYAKYLDPLKAELRSPQS